MFRKYGGCFILIFGFYLYGCDKPVLSLAGAGEATGVDWVLPAADSAPDRIATTRLLFEESESGIAPHIIRMLVTERHIRIDDGPDTSDFVLYDHVENRIYSVLSGNRQIFVVGPANPYMPAPDSLALREQRIEDKDMPAIAGVPTQYFQFFADDRLCYHVVAADGFLPQVAGMLLAYQKLLATQQQEIRDATPAELQTPCFLANYLYVPETYMSKGFPVRQWDTTGYRRSLESVQADYKVSPDLFLLPDSYRYLGMGINPGSPI